MIDLLVAKFAAANCNGGGFLGLVPWHKYIKKGSDCNVQDFNFLPAGTGDGVAQSDIPLVLLAVVDNLLRIAGLIAVMFVIYGGIMYATSQGNPDQTSKAQSTIINALVGLVIAVIAVTFVSFVGNRLTQ